MTFLKDEGANIVIDYTLIVFRHDIASTQGDILHLDSDAKGLEWSERKLIALAFEMSLV